MPTNIIYISCKTVWFSLLYQSVSFPFSYNKSSRACLLVLHEVMGLFNLDLYRYGHV